jgi:hypothetical protein
MNLMIVFNLLFCYLFLLKCIVDYKKNMFLYKNRKKKIIKNKNNLKKI